MGGRFLRQTQAAPLPSRPVAGFTLIELLVVMVIIGMMSAMVLPRLTGTLESMGLKTTARKISSILRFARSHAVSEGKTLVTVFDFDAQKIYLRYRDKKNASQSGETKDAPFERKLKSYHYDLPEGVRIEKAVFAKKVVSNDHFQISFYPTGGASGGKIFLKGQKDYTFKINVDMITGTVSLGQ